MNTLNHDEAVAFNSDGFCPNGCYEPAALNGDVYEISNASQYCWFAREVNSGSNSINGRLTENIDISADRFAADPGTMIGTSDYNYSGAFDGSGHTLTIKRISADWYAAPFRFISGAAIRNLKVKGDINTSAKYAAGLVGGAAGSCTIENCISDVTIASGVSGDGTHSGLVAVVLGDTTSIVNCAFRGTITGASTTCCAGMVGWADGIARFSNCYVAGVLAVDNATGSDTFARNHINLAFENCCHLNEFGATNIGPVPRSAEQFASGEVAYLLGAGWGQTIGAEDYPVPGGATVDRNQTGGCSESNFTYEYSNTQQLPVTSHTAENGICTVCGAVDESALMVLPAALDIIDEEALLGAAL